MQGNPPQRELGIKNFLWLTLFQTDADVQGILLRENGQNFLNSRIDRTLLQRRFSKNIDEGQFFITLEEEGPDDMQTLSREYILPRSEETSRVRGWVRGNTKIGPVLDVKVCYHQGRYGVEIMIES